MDSEHDILVIIAKVLICIIPLLSCVALRIVERKLFYNLSRKTVIVLDIAFRFLSVVVAISCMLLTETMQWGITKEIRCLICTVPSVFYVIRRWWVNKEPFLCLEKNSDAYKSLTHDGGKIYTLKCNYDEYCYQKIPTLKYCDNKYECFMLLGLKPKFTTLVSKFLVSKPDEIIAEASYLATYYPV